MKVKFDEQYIAAMFCFAAMILGWFFAEFIF